MATKLSIIEMVDKRDQTFDKTNEKIIKRCAFVAEAISISYKFKEKQVEIELSTVYHVENSNSLLFQGKIYVKIGAIVGKTVVDADVSDKSTKTVAIALPGSVLENENVAEVVDYINNLRNSYQVFDDFDYKSLTNEQKESLRLYSHDFDEELNPTNLDKLN